MQHVLAHIRQASLLGMIPVVDSANFKTLYNEATIDEAKTENAWDYYFAPVSLEEVYQSKNVFFCDGSYSWSMGYYLSEHRFYDIYRQRIKVREEIESEVDWYWQGFQAIGPLVGVHFRGKEQNVAQGHPFCPSRK